jgi:hypothetical protein
VGWYKLSRLEERLHGMLHRRGGDADSHRQATQGEGRGSQDTQGPQRSSQRCAAHLEATGVLGKQEAAEGGGGGAEATAAEGGAAAVAESAGFLQARRRLYDSMEASLLHNGLALGEEASE